MQVMGRDPHHFGRNKDIDLVKMLVNEYPTNASIYLKKKYISIQDKAASCHASQMGGRLLNLGFVNKILKLFNFIFGRRQYFMRVYPTVKNKQIETDLFQDI